jgi:predicted ArsR family transcriptional regulator
MKTGKGKAGTRAIPPELVAELDAIVPPTAGAPAQLLIEALGVDGGRTAKELAAAVGVSVGKVRDLLADAKAAGNVETVRVERIDLSDRMQTVPGYRLKKKGERQ